MSARAIAEGVPLFTESVTFFQEVKDMMWTNKEWLREGPQPKR
jgi:hypothetical protein